MATALTLLLIACLLQSAQCGEFKVFMQQTINVSSGSCVTIPCSFDVEDRFTSNLDETCKAMWRNEQDVDVFDSSNPQSPIKGNLIGDLTKKDCTTTLYNMKPEDSKKYYLRVECNNPMKYGFKEQKVEISVTDQVTPTLTPSTLEVNDGTSVTLTCSAPAPCLSHPPTLTWTPGLGVTQETLWENQDKTKVKISLLTFTATQRHHGQEISCTAVYNQQDGSTESSVSRLTADVSYPPQNTTVSVSPSGPVPEDSTVTLTCSSTANPAVRDYTWYTAQGGQETVMGTGHVLHIQASKVSVPFFCKAENDLGAGRSNINQIHVQYPPKHTTVSVSPSGPVPEDSTVTLICFSAANPAVRDYTWYTSQGGQETVIGTGHVLHIQASEVSVPFFCKAENDLGAGRSTISQIDVQYSPKHTTVSVSPSGPVPEDSTVTLTCSSTANPAVSDYTWYTSQGGQETVMGTGHVLHIQASKVSVPFFCEAENDLGAGRSTISQIDVQFAPQILPSSDCTQTADQLICSCETVGNPAPTLQWYLDGLPVNHSDKFAISSESLNDTGLRIIITVNQPQWRDLSTLLCRSSNSLGSVTQQFHFYSLESPTSAESHVAPQILPSSDCTQTADQLICSCETVGNPAPTLQWYLDGLPVNHSDKFAISSESLNDTGLRIIITVNQPQWRDLSTLLCRSSNSLGSVTQRFHFYSLESQTSAESHVAPQILPSSDCTQTADQLICSCETVGNPAPTLQWYLDGLPVNHSDKFAIRNESLNDTGLRIIITVNQPQWRDLSTLLCRSSNSLGSVTQRFHVYSVEPPTSAESHVAPQILPSSDCTQTADQLICSCETVGNPAPTLQWYLDGLPVNHSDKFAVSSESLNDTGLRIIITVNQPQWRDLSTLLCRSSNSLGSVTQRFHVYSLEPQTSAESHVVPKILPSSDCTQTADQLICSCETVGNPAPTLQWYLDGLPVNHSDKFAISSESLNDTGLRIIITVNQPQWRDLSTLLCRSSNSLGSVTQRFHFYSLEPQKSAESHVAPQILPSSDCTQTADQLICSCETVGNPAPTLQWYLDGLPVNHSDKFAVSNESLNNTGLRIIITVNQPQWRDLSTLLCRSSNSLGSVTQRFHVYSLEPQTSAESHVVPKILPSSDCTQTADQLICSCETVGNPAPTLQWYLDGLPVNHSDKFAISSESLNDTGLRIIITVNQPQWRDLSTLLCRSSNSLGSVTQQFHFYSFESPTSAESHVAPQILPSSDCTQTADQLICSCETVGNPAPTLQWYLDGLPVNHSDKFAISSESLNDTGLRIIITVNQPQWRDLTTLLCRSSNSLGSATQQFNFCSLEPQTSAETHDPVMLAVLIFKAVGLLVLVCTLFLFTRIQNIHHNRPETTVAMSQLLSSGEENEVPNTAAEDIYVNANDVI
ncbi:hemicentin-1 isoform X1 [Larimichthys crocea]|uniref:hemicentin-1 isoform X1 n=1 Tax=Larimichthys crocea TaxID=215358 RepID=UPI000F5E7158|nr:hemicentin-1 isoform X1 [Larimichthys crocea]